MSRPQLINQPNGRPAFREAIMTTPADRPGDRIQVRSTAMVTVPPQQPVSSNTPTDSGMKETMGLYLEELRGATETWVEQKGGLAKMGGANRTLLRTLKLVVHGMEQAIRLGGEDGNSPQALHRRIQSVERGLDTRIQDWKSQFEVELYDQIGEGVAEQVADQVYSLMGESEVREELYRDLHDRLLEDDAIETTERRDFVMAMMKAQKNAPETAQDKLTEMGMPID